MGDIYWLRPTGEAMDNGDWDSGALTVTVWLNGRAIHEPDSRGQAITDDDFLIFFNAEAEESTFVVPGPEWGERWVTEIDTCADVVDPGWREASSSCVVGPRSVVVLRCPRDGATLPTGAASSERLT